jgi:tripartite-type tricarboxylate transporter receptor subunit TctC
MRSGPWRLSAAAFVLILASEWIALAGFPERPIRIVLGFGAGGPTDIVARTLADALSRDLGQRVIVENQPGASGNIATQTIARANADGYTYLVGANPLAVNESLFPDFPFKFGKDIVAVAAIGTTATVLVVRPSLNVRNLAEFARAARAKRDGISYAAIGIGSTSHLAGVAFNLRTGSHMLAVEYHGVNEALKDLLGGNVDAWFATIPGVLGVIKAGQLTAIATTGPERPPSLPDVPTVAESGFPGYDIRLWVGVFARNGIPPQTLGVIEQAIGRAMKSDETRTALERQGIAPSTMNRDEFTAFVAQEVARAKTVVDAFKADEH